MLLFIQELSFSPGIPFLQQIDIKHLPHPVKD